MTIKHVFIVPPGSRRRSWDVHAFDGRGDWVGTWSCLSKEIAALVKTRVKNGRDPGSAWRDVRAGMTR